MLETKAEFRGQRSGCQSNICPAQSEGIAHGHDSYCPYSAPALPLLPAPSPPFTLLHSLPILKVANVSPKCPCIKGLVSRVALMESSGPFKGSQVRHP